MSVRKLTIGLILISTLLVGVFAMALRSNAPANAISLTVANEADLNAALLNADPNIDITIAANFQITTAKTVTAGKTVTIHSDATPRTLTRATTFPATAVPLFNVAAATGTLNLTNITLDGNKGSFVVSATTRSLVASSGTLNIQNGAVLQNNAVTTASVGGAITMAAGSTLNMTGGTIANNSAANGGAIYAVTPSVTNMTGGTISGNSVTASGGAIFGTGAASILNLSGGNIAGNTSASFGGAVYVTSGATGNIFGSMTIANNTANSGGGAAANATAKLYMYGNAMIRNNLANATGGGLYQTNASVIIDIRGSAKVIDNESQSNAGGIMTQGVGSQLTIDENAQVNGNSTRGAGAGGAVYSNGSAITIGGSATINGNRTNTVSGTSNGGGFYLAGGSFTMTGGSVSNNAAKGQGGGILFNNITAAISGGHVDGNSAVTAGGHVDGNSAVTAGGGMALTVASVTISDASVDSNSSQNGGGIFVTGTATASNLTINSGTSISHNTATIDGGGVRASSAATTEITVNGGVFDDNTATGNGGAIASTNILNVSGATIFSNNSSQNGGGIYQITQPITLNGSMQFTGNSASGNGGGLYLGVGTYSTMTDVQGTVKFSGNTASADGGGIWIDPNKLANLSVEPGVTFANNSAGRSFQMLPRDAAMYAANIHATAWTAPFAKGYNNVDIAYNGVTIDCQAEFGGTNAGRDGSESAKACLIYDAAGLDKLRNFVGADFAFSHFQLANDIDLTDFLASRAAGWNPIGDNTNHFDAALNGDGHVIDGLWINTTLPRAGLFGYLGTQPDPIGVSNLGIIIDNAKGGIRSTADTAVVGGLTATLRNVAKNVYVIGNLSVANSNNNAQVGGIAGRLDYGTITESYAVGAITATPDNIVSRNGGLVGHSYYGIIADSYANVSIPAGTNYYAGGLIGRHEGISPVSRSYAQGLVAGSGPLVGGLMGGGNISQYTDNYYSESTGQTIGIGNGLDATGVVERLATMQMLDPNAFANWNVNSGGSPWFMFMNPDGSGNGLHSPYLANIPNELLIKPGGSMDYSGLAPTDADGWFGVNRGGSTVANLRGVDVVLAWTAGAPPTEPGDYEVCVLSASGLRYQIAVWPVCGTFTINSETIVPPPVTPTEPIVPGVPNTGR